MFDLEDITGRCFREGCGGYLDWISTDGCYRCSDCDAEVWGHPSRIVSNRAAKQVYRLHQATIAKSRKHGGGNKSAGRKKKDNSYNPNIHGVQPQWRQYDET